MLGNYRRANPDAVNGDRKSRLFYVCSSARAPRARRTESGCQTARNHNGWALEDLVLQAIDEYIANPEAALQILRKQARERQGTSVQQDERIKALRVQLAEYEHGKAGLLALVRRGQIGQDEYTAQIAESAAEASAIRHELELLEADGALSAIIETRLVESLRVLHELRERWQKARAENDRAALRAMVQGTLREIRLDPDGKARINFVFSAPASRENNNLHYQMIWRDGLRPSAVFGADAGLVELELFRSLPPIRKPA
jgi:hypothetical protein